MNKQIPMGLIATGLFFAAHQAVAGESVFETLTAAPDGFVHIEHVNGQVEIQGWASNEVKVTGELGDRTEEFIFERDGDDILLKVKVKKQRNWNSWSKDDGDDLQIWLPEGSKLTYVSVNADVEVMQVYGGSDIETVNGDINVKDLHGRIIIEAVNGDIDADQLQGDAKINTVNGDIKDRSQTLTEASYETVNGDIRVTTEAREIKAETVNGDIELNLNEVEDLLLTTVNGSIEASMTLTSKSDVRASSVGGSIDLSLPRDVSARFDIEGHAGGRIVNDLTSDKPSKAKYGPSRWLKFNAGAGDARVEVSTVSGRIKLTER